MRADTWGPLGSAVAAACCLGLAPLVTALSAVGLGFLLDDRILIPVLVLFLAATAWQLYRDHGRHESRGPFLLVVSTSVLTVAGLWVSGMAVALGLAGVFAASLWNLWLVWKLRRSSRKEASS